LEKVEHDIKQTIANTGPEAVRKIARNTLKIVDACVREGGGLFQHLL
jgi:hypothetical protein